MKLQRIAPFLWVNDDTSENNLVNVIRTMKTMGLNSFIVESRIHSDFCGEKWFSLMGKILETAKNEEMKVWLLDDKSYPTGITNGALYEMFPNKNARRIIAKKIDVSGFVKNAKIKLNFDEKNDEILAVFLAERKILDKYLNVCDLSDKLRGDTVYLDIPKGNFSLIYLVDTLYCAERNYYVDMLNKDSVKVLIDTVYESHYKRFKEYFGNTFVGFFSDEPRFANGRYGNVFVGNDYETRIGRFGVAYPYSKEIKQELNFSYKDFLALWFDTGENTADVRIAYMEKITDKYARNFAGQISEWCHNHGVLYTGHIIEDMDAHTKTGCSAGHYFKSMYGMDAASIDVVLHQIKPFENDYLHYAPICGGYADPVFFNNTLAKLASSAARIDKNKHGNACCEIFGAYGWGESSSEMLFLANHMLVRGINMFIPHAFVSLFGFKDCPPHFYADGKNNATKAHGRIFAYMNKMANLLSANQFDYDYAVLYHAQAEWTGKNYIPIDFVNKELFDAQKDFDIVDFASLEKAEIVDDGFMISERKFKFLIVPHFEYLPAHYREIFNRLSKFIIDYDGSFSKEIYKEKTVGLRVLRHFDGNSKSEFLFNESFDDILYEYRGNYEYAVDVLRETYTKLDGKVKIAAGQAFLLCNGLHGELCLDGLKPKGCVDKFDVYVKGLDDADFDFYCKNVGLGFDINSFDNLPSFSGYIRYDALIDNKDVDVIKIEFEADCCEIIIGDKSFVGADKFIYIPLDENLKKEKSISIILSNSLAYSLQDEFSAYNYISPCMIKKIEMLKYENRI